MGQRLNGHGLRPTRGGLFVRIGRRVSVMVMLGLVHVGRLLLRSDVSGVRACVCTWFFVFRFGIFGYHVKIIRIWVYMSLCVGREGKVESSRYFYFVFSWFGPYNTVLTWTIFVIFVAFISGALCFVLERAGRLSAKEM